jgi:glycosyltransferase involved in cell wall biosynthesis
MERDEAGLRASGRAMRVLYLSIAPAGSQPYGVERITLDLIAAMGPTRHQALGVVLPSEGPTADAFRARGVPVLSSSLPEAGVRNAKTCWRFLRWGIGLAWRLRGHTPDIIVANHHELNRHAVLLGALMRRPVICHLFDTTPASLYRIRWAHRNAAIIACSRAIASYWQCLPDAKPKIRVIYPGIDAARFRSQPGARIRIRREFNLADGDPLVGVVSRLSPEKGVHDFVEAFALCLRKNDRVRAVIVGGAPSASAQYAGQLHQEAVSSGVGDRLWFAGFRSGIADMYAAFDLLVVPSRHEGFGRVLVEAMAAGLPLVATRVEGIPEVVVDGETGLLVEVGQPEALADAMLHVLANPDMARRMACAGRERVERCFTIKAQAQATQALYDEIVGSRSSIQEASDMRDAGHEAMHGPCADNPPEAGRPAGMVDPPASRALSPSAGSAGNMSQVRQTRPTVSVVIPTRNRSHLLERALEGLAAQTLPSEQFEVIVVSDGSTDDTEGVVERFRQRASNVRFLSQPHRGPAAARNRGIGLARGRIVAFTDDDCIPDKDWLRNLIGCFDENPQALGVEGKTITEEQKVTPLTHQIVNLRGGFSRPTCNVSYLREVLAKLGGFDEGFVFSAEDEDMTLTVSERGPIVFCDAATVVHPPRRLHLHEHLRQMARLELHAMLCEFRLASKHPVGYRRLRRGGPWRSIFYVAARIRLDDLWQKRRWIWRAPNLWFAALVLLLLKMSYRACLAPVVCLKLRSARSSSRPGVPEAITRRQSFGEGRRTGVAKPLKQGGVGAVLPTSFRGSIDRCE